MSEPEQINSFNIKETTFKHLREIKSLHQVINQRNHQRNQTLCYYFNSKHQSAIINGRQLLFKSGKIYKEFLEEYEEDFEGYYFYRNTSTKEYLEYLLDCAIVCKVFLAAKKREDGIELLSRVEVPDI